MTTIWLDENNDKCINIIDQRKLPFVLEIEKIRSSDQMAEAIREMHLRGAPLIGVAAAFGLYLGTLEARDHPHPKKYIQEVYNLLLSTRPTALNLQFGLNFIMKQIDLETDILKFIQIAKDLAQHIRQDEINSSLHIGKFGVQLIEELYKKKSRPINILTHCNAGWLACVEHGTATAPIYEAQRNDIPVHVWVDETRPRNQGARLTTWELIQAGVPNTLIADNSGGHLMQKGLVDMVIVGSDRTTSDGDVYNKIGTYLKALAAKDNQIPFYVAQPSTTIDRSNEKDITIEIRSEDEIHFMQGEDEKGNIKRIRISPHESQAHNPAFDFTPSHLISGFVTELGVCEASEEGIKALFKGKK